MNMSNMPYDVTSFGEVRNGSFNLISKEILGLYPQLHKPFRKSDWNYDIIV